MSFYLIGCVGKFIDLGYCQQYKFYTRLIQLYKSLSLYVAWFV